MHFSTESRVSDDAGNSVVVWRVEALAPEDRISVATLIKCGSPKHAMRKLRTIRISKPARFRKYGEGLIRDPSEGEVSTSVTTGQRIDDPEDLREEQELYDEVGQCANSIGETIRLTAMGTKTTTSRSAKIRFCRNCWIYSTAIEPTTEEQWQCLSDSLESGYDHVDYIKRPRQFAWSLGLMVVEQLGPRGRDQISTDSYGDEVVETRSRGQLIAHGPVIYVADPFRTINSARTDAERVLLPVFVKHHRFAGQREYRFVIWADEEPSENVVDLDISCAMFGSLAERPHELARLFDAGRVAGRDSKPTELLDVGEDTSRDSTSQEPLDSTLDWFWPGLLGSGDNPTTPLSRTIDPAEFAENPRAATTAAALSALRSKVGQVRGERRWRAASSAWHAEPWISHLCKRFVDPIGGVSITDDDILVVSLKFPEGVDAEAKITFGPTGAHVYAVKGRKEQLVSHSLSPDMPVVPTSLGRTLSRLGLTPYSAANSGSSP